LLRFVLVFIVLSLPFTATAPAAGPVTPTPYAATYAVKYRGLSVGQLHSRLISVGAEKFIFETRATPALLARLFVGGEAVERSVMRITEEGVRPLSWSVEDGKPGDKEDGALEFDWEANRVRGTVKGERVDRPAEPGLQDRLSLQVAVMTALLHGREPGTMPMIEGDRIKHYRISRTGSGRIETEAGTFETVQYEITRQGSSRRTRSWLAPALGYVPVHIERVRDGRIETVTELVTVAREGD